MKNFEDVIDFAIARENEAVTFYIDLAGMAKFTAQKEVLKEFENMEKGHVTLLQGIKSRGVAGGFPDRGTEDIHLADYLVESPPTEDMTYQDILLIAIKREQRSAALYTRLVNEAEDSESRAVFAKLVEEEKGHKSHFERLYERDIVSEN